jgi:hypothetical protein
MDARIAGDGHRQSFARYRIPVDTRQREYNARQSGDSRDGTVERYSNSEYEKNALIIDNRMQ